MPSTIKTIVADSRWSDWEITGWVIPMDFKVIRLRDELQTLLNRWESYESKRMDI